MKALLVLLLVVPIVLLSVLNQQLTGFTPPRVAPATITVHITPVALATSVPTPMATTMPNNLVEALIAQATTWLGVPYLWGGTTRRGVDCSAFVQNVLATVGIRAPRVTVQQIAWAQPLGRTTSPPVGALLFYDNTCSGCGPNPTHVAMYIGNGMMVNAGDPVQIAPAFNAHYRSAGWPPGL